MLKVAIDNGHGKEYIGKWSPILPDTIEIDPECVDHTGRFREYLYNRKIKKLLFEKCKDDAWLKLYDIVPEDNDISLKTRKNRINALSVDLSISLHANAAGLGNKWENARGFCVYTSIKQDWSDKPAQIIFDNYKEFYQGELQLRQDLSDGDSDYEANFAMVTGLNCRSVLIECNFYDNIEDVQLLMNETFQTNYVAILRNSLIDINNII